MKSYYYTIIVFVFVLAGCSAWKEVLVAEGNQNDAVRNAIHDFLHTERLSKKDTVFSILIEDVSTDILGITIIGDNDKLLPSPKNKIGTNHPYFPTRHFEKENKLFHWYDSTSTITNELVAVLSEYNHIDSLNVKGIVELRGSIDDSKKGVDYYFCKNNLLKYKKVVTSRAMGYYDPPTLKCSSR